MERAWLLCIVVLIAANQGRTICRTSNFSDPKCTLTASRVRESELEPCTFFYFDTIHSDERVFVATTTMDIPLSSDALDLSFHPSNTTNLLAVGLISGKIQLINYDDYLATPSSSTAPPPPHKKIRTADVSQSKRYTKVWNARPSRKSCRGLHFDAEDGRGIWSISKDKSLFLTDTETGKVQSSWLDSHESAPSRVLPIDAHTVVTGDDEGVVRVWDPRKPAPKPVRQYDHHFDWITDMLYVPYLPEKRKLPPKTDGAKQSKKELQNKLKKERKKARKAEYQRQAAGSAADDEEEGRGHDDDDESDMTDSDEEMHRGPSCSRLVVTSGDGSLSSIDLRMTGPTAFEVSEDQEDELLCVTALKNSSKLVVGTQMGILSLWAPRRGLLDHVDRVPGHPASVDTLCMLDQDTVLTGSSDGLVRVVQILPSKLLGVIADHDGLPIERMKRKQSTLATIGHSNAVKLTDLSPLLNDDDDEESEHHLGLIGLSPSADHNATTTDDDDDNDVDTDDEDDDNNAGVTSTLASPSNPSDSDDDSASPPPPPTHPKTQRSNPNSTTAFFDDM